MKSLRFRLAVSTCASLVVAMMITSACGSARSSSVAASDSVASLSAQFLENISPADRQAVLDAVSGMSLAEVHSYLTGRAGGKLSSSAPNLAEATLTLQTYLSEGAIDPVHQTSAEFALALNSTDQASSARRAASVNLFLGLFATDLAGALNAPKLGLTDAAEANLRCFLSKPLARALQHWSAQNPRNKYNYFGSGTSTPTVFLPGNYPGWNDKPAFSYTNADATIAVSVDPNQPSRVTGVSGTTASGEAMSPCTVNDIGTLAQSYQSVANQSDQLAAMMAGVSL